ncbi:MAG TPA: DUF5985 family protein [Gemmatimonadales bacterium]|jgi:hypothetical protein
MTSLQHTLLGAVAMGTLAIGLIFLRLWRDSADRFFLFFALSFFVQAFNRVALSFATSPQEGSPWHYGVRFLAYVLIILAIVDKNRAPTDPLGAPTR